MQAAEMRGYSGLLAVGAASVYGFQTLANIVRYLRAMSAGAGEAFLGYSVSQYFINPVVRGINDAFPVFDRYFLRGFVIEGPADPCLRKMNQLARSTLEIIVLDVVLGTMVWFLLTLLLLRGGAQILRYFRRRSCPSQRLHPADLSAPKDPKPTTDDSKEG